MTTHDPATFDDIVAYANESGWIVYQLNQACGPADPPWRCTLRESNGGNRRNICNGKGETPQDAIMSALSEAPEPEADTDTYNGVVVPDRPSLDSILGLRTSAPLTIRRR